MEDIHYKNILIINNYSMFEQTPEGITLKNIFNDWPENQLIEIYRYGEILENKTKKSFKLPANTLPIDKIIRKIIRKEIKVQKKNTFQISKSPTISLKQKLKMLIKYFAESLFFCNKDDLIYRKIKEFCPQIIYTSGESLFTLKASLFFSEKFDIPVIVHYMDNWRETLYPPTFKILNYLFAKNLGKIEKRMKNGLVISPKMKEEYSLINPNIRYRVLLNSVPAPSVEPGHSRIYDEKEIIFSYNGGLHLNRWESLLEVEKCICELNRQGVSSKLHIYTPDADAAEFSDRYDPNFTIFKGYLSHDKVNLAYETADILVHIESFESQVINYTKYSLSTKIPECMATGKPILCYAPGFLAVSEYINDTQSGISVDNYNDLLKAAVSLSTDKKLRLELGKNGIITVLNSHTQKRAIEILIDSL